MKNTRYDSEHSEQTENHPNYGTAMPEFLLQRHRSFLFRLTAIQISNRAINIVLAGLLILAKHPSLIQLFGPAAGALIINFYWYRENKKLDFYIENLEEIMAKQSDSNGAHAYGKWRYFESTQSTHLTKLSLFEPQAWLILAAWLFILQIIQYLFALGK